MSLFSSINEKNPFPPFVLPSPFDILTFIFLLTVLYPSLYSLFFGRSFPSLTKERRYRDETMAKLLNSKGPDKASKNL